MPARRPDGSGTTQAAPFNAPINVLSPSGLGTFPGGIYFETTFSCLQGLTQTL